MKIASLGLGLAVVACALMAPAMASAHDQKPTINKAQRREQARIRQGMRSGELTRAEAARLEAEQARLQVWERYNRADGGGLTAKERERLYKELHQASRHIYNQKHDKQDR
jgi:hypothetical protein